MVCRDTLSKGKVLPGEAATKSSCVPRLNTTTHSPMPCPEHDPVRGDTGLCPSSCQKHLRLVFLCAFVLTRRDIRNLGASFQQDLMMR